MQRVYNLQTEGEPGFVSFVSKAKSVSGVFRSFLKNSLAKYLKAGKLYTLYVAKYQSVITYKRIGFACFNGTRFVQIELCDDDKGEFNECQEQ